MWVPSIPQEFGGKTRDGFESSSNILQVLFFWNSDILQAGFEWPFMNWLETYTK